MATADELQILLAHPLTPKGRRLVKEAIDLLLAEDARSSTKLAEVDEWWKATFADAKSFGMLQGHMFIIQRFLLNVLSLDYLNLHYKPPQFVDDLCNLVAEERTTGPRPLGNLLLRKPAEQMEMDPSHITKRLLKLKDAHKAGMSAAFPGASHDSHDQEALRDLLPGDCALLDRLNEQEAISAKLYQLLHKAMEKVKRGSRGEVSGSGSGSWQSWIQTQGERLFFGASKASEEAPQHTPGHFDSKFLKQDSRDAALSHDIDSTGGSLRVLSPTNGQMVYNRKQGTRDRPDGSAGG